MLTTLLVIVTFLLVVAVAAFLGVVSSKQFRFSQTNRARILHLAHEDDRMNEVLNVFQDKQDDIVREWEWRRSQDMKEIHTEALDIGENAEKRYGAKIGTKRPYEDSQNNRGMDRDKGLHVTDRTVDKYAPIAVSKLWSADGVMLDGGSCLETGVNEANSRDDGKICSGKISNGLDIIGKGDKSFPSSPWNKAVLRKWEDDLRKVYIHDFLRTQGVNTDMLKIKGGISEDDPGTVNQNTVFASKEDGKNHISGDTTLRGEMRVDGRIHAGGSFVCKGGSSEELNPGGHPTVFADPTENGNNVVRGNTHVEGDLNASGKLQVNKESVFKPADTKVPLDPMGRFLNTTFGNAETGENVIRGDTHVSGDVHVHGDTINDGDITTNKKLTAQNVSARRIHVANDTEKNNIVLEGGNTSDGKNEGLSSVNFNGNTENGDRNFDSDKMRWRVGADQRGTRDRFFIDRFGGGDIWTPVSIRGGTIRLQGDVRVCDDKGKNCKKIQLATASESG